MKRFTKKNLMVLALSLTAAMLFGVFCMPVRSMAQENGEVAVGFGDYLDNSDGFSAQESSGITGQIVVLSNDADAYVAPDESAEIKISFSAGDSIFLVEEEGDWYRIFYQGEDLYVKSDRLSSEDIAASAASFNEQSAGIVEEFESLAKEDEIFTNAAASQERRQRNSLIWIIIIAVLVVAIIGVAVFTALKGKKKEEEKKAPVRNASASAGNVQATDKEANSDKLVLNADEPADTVNAMKEGTGAFIKDVVEGKKTILTTEDADNSTKE